MIIIEVVENTTNELCDGCCFYDQIHNSGCTKDLAFLLLYSVKMTRLKKHKFQTNVVISYEKESNNICDRRSIYE